MINSAQQNEIEPRYSIITPDTDDVVILAERGYNGYSMRFSMAFYSIFNGNRNNISKKYYCNIMEHSTKEQTSFLY